MTCDTIGQIDSICVRDKRRLRVGISVVCILTSLLLGCELRPKTLLLKVEYQSDQTCVPRQGHCPWPALEQQARFIALVNCLLSGATTLDTDDILPPEQAPHTVVAPHAPRYGYAQVTRPGDEAASCPAHETICQVTSRHDRERTWAVCGTESTTVSLRGGKSLATADRVTESVVLTGRLLDRGNEFGIPQGLDGPDQFFTFTLTKPERIEIAVAANTAFGSGKVGFTRAPWQPAVYLLSADGTPLKTGHSHRAGVAALFPEELEPGTYVIVVDSSMREWSRGDGVYRLYVGFNKHLLGPPVQ